MSAETLANFLQLTAGRQVAGEEHDHDHDHDHDDDDDESIVLAKVTAMLTLFSVSMICGIVPFKLALWFKWNDSATDRKASLIVSLLLSFGGGALLCTTFQHLLPEINETIHALTDAGKIRELDFSLGEFLMCAGFFIIYLVEEVVHVYLHHHDRKRSEKKNAHEAVLAGDAIMRGTHARESVIMRKKAMEVRNDSISTADLISNAVDTAKHGVVATGEVCVESGAASAPPHEHEHQHHRHVPVPVPEDGTLVSSLRGLLIVLALSVHELFEGLAVGLEGSSSTVWYMFGAVAAHKFVIAFCVGVELIVARTRFWMTVTYIFVYAVVSPVGIGIGILLSNGDNAEDMEVVSVILQGLASGTLLYVIFFEVLSKERSGLRQYLAVLVGFFVMFGIKFLTGHGHSHSHSTATTEDGDGH